MKGITRHVFPTAFSSCPSAHLSRDLTLAKTHGAWLQDLMKLRLLMSHWKNFSERQKDRKTGKRWICSDSERSTLHRVWAITGEQPWNVMWLVFASWVISYANGWEDHSNNQGATHSSVFWQWLGPVLAPLGVSFSLQIEDQGLLEFDLSSWIHLI